MAMANITKQHNTQTTQADKVGHILAVISFHDELLYGLELKA